MGNLVHGTVPTMSETPYFTLICGVCGYQWDENFLENTEFAEPDVVKCPICDAGNVHLAAFGKKEFFEKNGEEYDGQPWY